MNPSWILVLQGIRVDEYVQIFLVVFSEIKLMKIELILSSLRLQIKKAIYFYKRYGFFDSIKRFIGILGFEHFSRTLIFLVLDLKSCPDDIDELHSLCIGTIEDIQEVRDYYNNAVFTKDEAVYRFQKGHNLFFLKKSNEIICSIWVEQQNAAVWWFDDLPFNLPQDVALLSGLYTLPEYRRNGAASQLKKAVFQHLKKRGISYLIEGVHPANKAALLMDKKLGFKQYQIMTYKRYWHIRHYTVQRFNSEESKTFITLFRAPKDIWRTFFRHR